MIGIQADMWDPAIEGGPNPVRPFHSRSCRSWRDQALRFDGQVLLLNGDSHQFVDDYPLADPPAPQNKSIYGIASDVPNLHRITVNGSTTPCHEWLKLTSTHTRPASSAISASAFTSSRASTPPSVPKASGPCAPPGTLWRAGRRRPAAGA